MYEERDEDGISLLEFFKVFFGRKILMLIITLSIVVIGVVLVKFAYNPGKTTYTTSYNYTIIGLDEEEYIDGSRFDYNSLISLDNLKMVKASNADFSNINVEKLYENDDIEISRSIVFLNEPSKDVETKIYKEVKYRISVCKKYFKSKKQAVEFSNAVATIPYNKTLELLEKAKYDSYLVGAKTSNSYENQISFLILQEELLQENYKTLIEKYGDRTLSTGTKISDYFNTLSMYLKDNKIENLNALIEENGYVKNYALIETEIINEKKALENEKALNNSTIEALTNTIKDLMDEAETHNITSVDVTAYNTVISELTIRNIEIQKALDIIDTKIANKDQSTEEFDTLINKYQSELEKFTNDFISTQKEVVNNEAAVNVLNNKPVTQGNMKMTYVIVMCLLAGIFASGCINLVVDRKKLFNKEDKAENNQ